MGFRNQSTAKVETSPQGYSAMIGVYIKLSFSVSRLQLQLKPKLKMEMSSKFLGKAIHRYQCYPAILVCVLMLIPKKVARGVPKLPRHLHHRK